MKAGIGLDNWKLPVFREGLTQAGFSYTDAGEFTHDTTILHVEYTKENRTKLEAVVRECNETCKKLKSRG
jgi:hypothetical protein